MEHIKPRRAKPGYQRVVVSDDLTWTATQLIDFFLRTNSYAVTPSNRELVRVVLRQYPGPRPLVAANVMSYLTAAFIK